MHSYRQLRAWHLAQDVGVIINGVFPPTIHLRAPGLRTQVSRAATSVSANIVEGSSRRSPKEFRRFLEYSLGSLLEVENGLDLALRSNALKRADYISLTRKCNVLRRMITALMKGLEQ